MLWSYLCEQEIGKNEIRLEYGTYLICLYVIELEIKWIIKIEIIYYIGLLSLYCK